MAWAACIHLVKYAYYKHYMYSWLLFEQCRWLDLWRICKQHSNECSGAAGVVGRWVGWKPQGRDSSWACCSSGSTGFCTAWRMRANQSEQPKTWPRGSFKCLMFLWCFYQCAVLRNQTIQSFVSHDASVMVPKCFYLTWHQFWGVYKLSTRDMFMFSCYYYFFLYFFISVSWLHRWSIRGLLSCLGLLWKVRSLSFRTCRHLQRCHNSCWGRLWSEHRCVFVHLIVHELLPLFKTE